MSQYLTPWYSKKNWVDIITALQALCGSIIDIWIMIVKDILGLFIYLLANHSFRI